MPEVTSRWSAHFWFPDVHVKRQTDIEQLTELGKSDLPVIGGKECDGVTQTPANGEGFKLGNIAVKGLYTPCHTQDSICWYMQDGDQKAVFTGDTLFHGGTCSFSMAGAPQKS